MCTTMLGLSTFSISVSKLVESHMPTLMVETYYSTLETIILELIDRKN